MFSFSSQVPSWDTSSKGHPDKTSHTEHLMLGKHLAHCRALQGPLKAMRFGIARLHCILKERVLTGAMLIAFLAGTVWLVM